MNDIINCIKDLSREEIEELLFDYSNYVIDCGENDKQPVCVMEYYENDWEIV